MPTDTFIHLPGVIGKFPYLPPFHTLKIVFDVMIQPRLVLYTEPQRHGK
jgi:hypothetical protein